ncbi:uncharacterized protein HaLaN_22275 [Haematococcus lacustris]|uniref:Uncharacterized protein n=1 Tax=Haematococcus lacustris TaxID=44745 RepID=A0A699ZXU9_HAELA|nr:uncharacterized protein HaLaN_22275 [Haematococcus lacustris]
MSVMGVVHVQLGGPRDGEFMPLGEWIRLSSIFDILRNLRFFKHFATGKALRLWRRTVAASKYRRVRKAIGKKLYAAVSTFQPTMSKVYSLVHDIATTPFNVVGSNPALTPATPL